jgi:hypothetical protein
MNSLHGRVSISAPPPPLTGISFSPSPSFQVDLMNHGTDVSQYLTGAVPSDLRLALGYFAIRNRSPAESKGSGVGAGGGSGGEVGSVRSWGMRLWEWGDAVCESARKGIDAYVIRLLAPLIPASRQPPVPRPSTPLLAPPALNLLPLPPPRRTHGPLGLPRRGGLFRASPVLLAPAPDGRGQDGSSKALSLPLTRTATAPKTTPARCMLRGKGEGGWKRE